MKERPILFSAPMVRAILSGTKTQTRRIVKLESLRHSDIAEYDWQRQERNSDWTHYTTAQLVAAKCPYGAPGDRLWVRETWGLRAPFDFTDWRRDSVAGLSGLPDDTEIDYRADWQHDNSECFWRPSIHMPRWASRITLEVTSVRVERLQEITEEDARAEGVEPLSLTSAVEGFANLWCDINGADSWTANPWVWVVGFRRMP